MSAAVEWRHRDTICLPDLGVHLGCRHADDLPASPPDVVPRPVVAALSLVEEIGAPTYDRTTRYHVLLPAPDWARWAHVGDRRRTPALTLYYTRAAGERCKGCHTRRREGRTPRVPSGVVSAPHGRPLEADELARLRALVPCLGCGRVLTERRSRRGNVVVRMLHVPGCPVAGIREGRG